MTAEATVITAIHNIKSNKGSETPGVDGKKVQMDYLQKPFQWVINDIQSAFSYYVPQKIRREYIDKPGKSEKRPLGIPAIYYNFEFYMNRAYALNRDKLKCRVCGGWLISGTPYAHRINPFLP